MVARVTAVITAANPTEASQCTPTIFRHAGQQQSDRRRSDRGTDRSEQTGHSLRMVVAGRTTSHATSVWHARCDCKRRDSYCPSANSAFCQASGDPLLAPLPDSSLCTKKDSGDKIAKTDIDNTGSPNINQKPSNTPKSRSKFTFIDDSPRTRRDMPRINPKVSDDERVNMQSCLM